MTGTSSDLKMYLLEDAKQARCGDINTIKGRLKYWAKLFVGSEDAHALRYLRVLRQYEYELVRKRMGIINRMIIQWKKYRWMRLGLRYGIHIDPNTVGYGLRIPHITGGIIINCESMGNYCGVNGGVIIGSHKNKKPIIGDNVHIAIGAKIYGGIIIGDNVKIAPNSVVFKSIDANKLVGGNPAKLIN